MTTVQTNALLLVTNEINLEVSPKLRGMVYHNYRHGLRFSWLQGVIRIELESHIPIFYYPVAACFH